MIALQDKLQEELKKCQDAYEFYSAANKCPLCPDSTAKWATEEIYRKGLPNKIYFIEQAISQLESGDLTWQWYLNLNKIFESWTINDWIRE